VRPTGAVRFAIVAARFNEKITKRLVDGAVQAFAAAGVRSSQVDVHWVPGSFELPQAAGLLARSGRYRAIACVGVVIRGQTPHFEHVAREAATGIREVALATGVPVTFGVITALNEELSVIYPEPGVKHFRLDPEEVAPGRGAFLIVRRDGVPIGCGAIRRIDAVTGELKRMYVVPDARGLGVGRLLVEALEDQARQLGLTRVVLETGTRQQAAIALYRRLGFVDIPQWGEYIGSPVGLCMGKEIINKERSGR